MVKNIQKPYETRVSPRLAQSIHRCRPGYGPGYGQPGRQFGPTGSPRGYGAGPWWLCDYPTTLWEFNSSLWKTIIYIHIYIYECFTGRHNHHSRTKWAVASIFMWKLFNDLRITLYILIQWYIGWADGPQWRTFFREETTKSASNGSYKPSSNKQFDYILGSPFCHVFLVCQDMWMLRNSGIKKRFVDKEDTVQAKM